MKAQNLQEFSRELAAAERLGSREVRGLGGEALEKWGSDWKCLADLSDLFCQCAYPESGHQDDGLSEVYRVLLHETFEYAKEHLDRGDYHRFCKETDYCFF